MCLKNFSTAIYDISVPCNYRCIYCRNDWENPENCTQPDFEQVKAVIDKISDWNIKKIILTGGEFFTIPYWKEVLSCAKEKGFTIWLITNASLMKPNEFPFLEQHVERISVSFHSPNKKLYHQIMGITKGNMFGKVIENLQLLKYFKIETGILFSPLRTNYKSLFDTIQFLKESGIRISHVNLNRIIPTQHTLTYFEKQAPLSYFEHKVLIEQLVRVNRELHIPAFAEAYPVCFLNKVIEEKELIKQINQPCFLGRKAVAVNNDGSLKLCPATGFSIDPQTIEDFNKKDWRRPVCRECPHWDYCLGGCHASRGQVYSDDSLIIEDSIQLKEKIDPTFFDLLINLYKPFLSPSFKKARFQYTVFSNYNYPHPIGIIAVDQTASNANFVEIALIPGLKEKYYSFLALQELFHTLSIDKYGWTVHKANLPSIKLLEKLEGGFHENTVKDENRIEAEGFFRVHPPVSIKMQKALETLIPQAQIAYPSWLAEYNRRKKEKEQLFHYLKGYKV